jgi:non-specific serine/threonine protein kinase
VGQSERDVFESGGWEVAARELRANGAVVPIGSRAFDIVEKLVSSDGELVTKEDIVRHAWPGATIVEDATISVHISAIRKALGGGPQDAANGPRSRLSSARLLDNPSGHRPREA